MTQALHILRKDVRRLWAPLLITLAVQVLFVFFEMGPQHGPVGFAAGTPLSPEALVDLLLPVAWWFLVVRLVHGEALPGNRQFWVTRPYRRSSLLAAKALYIVLFINLPVLIADCIILKAQGFSAVAHWQGILWKQVPFTMMVLLPALALASVTRNLGQVVMAVLLILLRIVANSFPLERSISPGYTAVDWIDNAVFLVLLLCVLGAVVLIQYRARRTLLAGGLLAAFLLGPNLSIPFGWQLAVQGWVKPPKIRTAGIRVAFDAARGRRSPLAERQIGYATVELPVVATGVPAGVTLVSQQARVTVGNHSLIESAALEQDRNGYWQTILLPAEIYRSVASRPVDIRIQPVVTAVRNSEFRIPIQAASTRPFRVPDLGICECRQLPGQPQTNINCRWALRSPQRTHVHANYPGWDTANPHGEPNEGTFGTLSDSPLPAELSLSPVHAFGIFGLDSFNFQKHPYSQIVFRTEHPLAHFETEIELRSVVLKDYAVFAPAGT